MADTLYIKDGSVEVLFREDSFERILRDRLGNEAGDYYAEQVDKLNKEINRLQNSPIKVKLDDCKLDLDSYRDYCFDLLGKIEELNNHVKTIKNEVDSFQKTICDIESDINEQLET